jgi:hypothetical protein
VSAAAKLLGNSRGLFAMPTETRCQFEKTTKIFGDHEHAVGSISDWEKPVQIVYKTDVQTQPIRYTFAPPARLQRGIVSDLRIQGLR